MKTVLRSSIALSALTLALMSGSPASAGYEMVVIETNSAQFARGAIIDGAQPVSLEAGQSLTLIDSDGEVVTLTGPFAQAPVDLTNSGGGGQGTGPGAGQGMGPGAGHGMGPGGGGGPCWW